VSQVTWSRGAVADLERLHAFLSEVDPHAAARAVRKLVQAPERLTLHPRRGQRLRQFDPREVRRLIVGPYEMRYEIVEERVVVLRIFHAREAR
jgi:plasmid stabilization system protein ParE